MKGSLIAISTRKLCYFIILFLLMCSCSQRKKISDPAIVSVNKTVVTTPLYYTGIIQPIKTIVIQSPVDGVVIEKLFQYGDVVSEKTLLFKISSTKFSSDYKSALMQYIKTKNDFNTAQGQLTEAKFLYKNQLISDDEFKTRQSNYYANQLALIQAKDALENLLRQLDIKNINLYQLSISDIDKITQALHLQDSAENLNILAPVAGVFLSSSKNEDENKKINKGDVIKQGDVLAMIGDMGGISINIKINELVVNQLKIGQKVKITGVAFPEDELDGVITQINRQADNSSNGLPTFQAIVVAPKLTAAQQANIHVGMSAKVEIDLKEEAKILLPIAAVVDKNGVTYAKLYNEKTHEIIDTPVKVGPTTIDSLVILAGLKAGDKIVIPH